METRERQISSGLLLTLSGLVVLAAIPHFSHLNIQITLFFLFTLLIRVAGVYIPRLLPGRLLLFVLTLAGIVLVISHHTLLYGKRAGVALLTVMLALKLLELKRRRDLFVVLFLSYFFLVTLFLFTQGIMLAGYVLLLVTGFTALLLEASRQTPGGPRKVLLPTLSLVVQALPIMVALFVFFPRLSGPLWNLGAGDNEGVTGLGDSITMGSLSRLIESDAVAFRADFPGQFPERKSLYWRGPVLWHTDGKKWDAGNQTEAARVEFKALSDSIEYSVTQEPSDKPWLFALELPDRLPREARITPDFQITSTRPLNQRHRYNLSSRLVYNTGPLTERERRMGLQLPPTVTTRMRQLVGSWAAADPDPLSIANRSLSHFRNEPFFYTLMPPLLGDNPVDEFLFESRRGFCEHYATSFVTLMRVAGIPSRVVTGYQGGEINTVGNYLVVRQLDAHAWAELWIQGRGWIRVDPTAAVAPDRIGDSFRIDAGDRSSIGLPVSFRPVESDWMKRLARQVRFGLDALNTSWNRWVLGYSDSRQLELMKRLGLGFLQGTKLVFGMLVSVGTLVVLIMAWLWYRGRDRLDPVLRDYLRFCARLERRGLGRLAHEGPKDYARRVTESRPDLKGEVSDIVRLYIGLRYGKRPSGENAKRFHRLVKEFRP